ncbi:hypothetical protein, partial [Achromobacter xylosoxidans]
PTTPWFVARYSIQLSYGRLKKQALNHSVVSQTAQVACRDRLHGMPPASVLIPNMALPAARGVTSPALFDNTSHYH